LRAPAIRRQAPALNRFVLSAKGTYKANLSHHVWRHNI
jgi:hypothetical protein